jgi:phage shock protein E
MRERHEELEPYADQQLVLYCRSGRRSGIAMDILEEEGFTNLVNAGGLRDLQAQGVPTTGS